MHEENIVLSGGRDVAAFPPTHLALEAGTELEVGHQCRVGLQHPLTGRGSDQRSQLVRRSSHLVHILSRQSRRCRFCQIYTLKLRD